MSFDTVSRCTGREPARSFSARAILFGVRVRAGELGFVSQPRRIGAESMSRRMRYQVAVSLDGFIAGPNGEYDWIVMDPAVDFAALFKEFDRL